MEKTMEAIITDLEGRIYEIMDQWHVEGLSLGIVKDKETILAKGYGKRDKMEGLDMTEKTVLPIGSATKSFTALALGMLADEGKLDLDKPVKSYIPWLELYTPDLTEHVTARDLLCHRTGVARYDAAAVFCTDDNREKMVRDLKYYQTFAPLGEAFQYSNQMVMLAGYLAEVLSGKSWEQFVKERIFEPLGMKESDFFVEQIQKYEDRSKGYVFTGTDSMETEYLPLRGVAPAGSIISTALDMNRYMQFQLGDGTWEGQRLISREILEQMHSVQMHGTPYLWKLPEMETADYGLGWFVDTYRGCRMVSHGGNTLGFSSLVTLLPEKNLGICVQTNANSSFLVNDLTYRIVDQVLGAEDTDWTERLQTEVGNLYAGMAAAQEQHEKEKIQDTRPSHPLEEYPGTYMHPAFGKLAVEEKEGAFSGALNGYPALFTHYHYDVYDVTLPTMGLTLPARFLTGWNGKISGLEVILEGMPGIEPAVFERKESHSI